MSLNFELQEFGKGVITGDGGKMTTLTAVLCEHTPVPAAPAAVFPQATERTYRACTVWHPGVVTDGAAEKVPPSMLY
jgi:hypothetical protein